MREKSKRSLQNRYLSFFLSVLMLLSIIVPAIQPVMAAELDENKQVEEADLAMVRIEDTEHGYLSFESSINEREHIFPKGQNIIINVHPESGYKADTVTFQTETGEPHKVPVQNNKASIPVVAATTVKADFVEGIPLGLPPEVREFSESEAKAYEEEFEKNKEEAEKEVQTDENEKIADDTVSGWLSAEDSREIAYILAKADRNIIGKGDKLLPIDYVSVANTVINLNKTKARTLDEFWKDRDGDGITEDVGAIENQIESKATIFATSAKSDYVVAKPTDLKNDELQMLEYAVGDSNTRGINLKDDIIYDEETGLLYIKKKAILPLESKDGEEFNRMGRIRFQSLLGIRERFATSGLKITVKVDKSGVNGDVPTFGEATVSPLEQRTVIKLANDEEALNSIKGYTIDSVIVNSVEMSKERFDYNEETGVLTIDKLPAEVEDVNIKMSNTLAKSISNGVKTALGLQEVKAKIPEKGQFITKAYEVIGQVQKGDIFRIDAHNTYLESGSTGQGYFTATFGDRYPRQGVGLAASELNQITDIIRGTLDPNFGWWTYKGRTNGINYWRYAYTVEGEYTASISGAVFKLDQHFNVQLGCAHVLVDSNFNVKGHVGQDGKNSKGESFGNGDKDDDFGILMSVLEVGHGVQYQGKEWDYMICGIVNPTQSTQAGFGMIGILIKKEKTPEKGKSRIGILKVGEDPDTRRDVPLAGVTFGVYKSEAEAMRGGTPVTTMTTDSGGKATAEVEPSTTYYIKEIRAPQGMEIIDQVFPVQSPGEGILEPAYANRGMPVMNEGPIPPPERKDGSVEIYKVDYDEGFGLEGAVFEIDGREYRGTAVTDSRGYAYFDNIPPGSYIVREVEAPRDYDPDPELSRGIDIDVRDGETTEVGGRRGVENEKQKGWISVDKSVSLPHRQEAAGRGLTFSVYDDRGRRVDTIEIGYDGRGQSKELPVGQYTVEEDDYQNAINVIVDRREYNVTVRNREVTDISNGRPIYNDYPLADVQFSKKEIRNQDISPFTNSNYFANSKFSLRINSIDPIMSGQGAYPVGGFMRDESGRTIVDDYTDGKISFSDLPIGDYSVVEVDTGNGKIPKNPMTLDFSVVRGRSQGTVEVRFGRNGSAEWAAQQANAGKKEDINPDKYGVGRPKFYDTPRDSTTFYNFLELGDVKIVKREKQAKTNDSLLKDVEFTLQGITDPNFKMMRYTNNRGELEFKELPHGKYKVYESKVPAGYRPNNWMKEFTVEPGNTKFNFEAGETVYNEDIRVDIAVEKKDVEGIETDISVFEGIKFRFRKLNMVKDAHTITPEQLDTVVEVKNGIAELKNIPLGRYEVTEVDMPDKSSRRYFWQKNGKDGGVIDGKLIIDATKEGNIVVESNNTIQLAKQQVTNRYQNLDFKEDAKTSLNAAEFVFANGARYGVIKVHKKYPQTDQSLKGAVFRIHGGPNNYYDKQYTTGEDGTFMTEPLRVSPLDGSGNYYIEEIQPPDGFVFAQDHLGAKGEILLKDALEEYEVLLDENQKYTEVVPGHKHYKFVNNERVYSPKFKVNKPSITGDYMGEAKFVGAEFDLYCRKIDYPGIIGEKQPGELIGHYVTDENGQFEIEPLPSGFYELIETKAPEGFLLNPNPITIEIKRTSYTNPVGEIIVHQRENYQGLEDELNNMRRHLTEIKNGMLDAEEAKTYEHSVLGLETKHTPENNQSQVEFMELVIMGRIEINKKYDDQPWVHTNDKEQVPEEGIEFTIYPADEDGKPNAEPIEKIYTDKNGKAVSKYLPYGKYVVRQTNKTDDRVDLVNEEIFEIRQNKDVFRYNLTNLPTRMRLRIVKWDKDTKKIVNQAGTTFELYAAEDMTIPYSGGKLRYHKDEKIEFQVATGFTSELVTNEEGYTDTFHKLYAGNYYLKEKQGPEGYYVDDQEKFFVTIPTEDELKKGAVNTVEILLKTGEKETGVNKDIENQPQYGELTINKVAEQLTGWTTETRTVKYQEPETLENHKKETAMANVALTLESITMKEYKEQSPKQGMVDQNEYYINTKTEIVNTKEENSTPEVREGTEILSEEDFKNKTELAAKVNEKILEGESLEVGIVLIEEETNENGIKTTKTITVTAKTIKVPGGKTEYETKVTEKPFTEWEKVFTDKNGHFARDVGPGKYKLYTADKVLAELTVQKGSMGTIECQLDPEVLEYETYVPGLVKTKDYTVNRPVYEVSPLKDVRFELIATDEILSYDKQTVFYNEGDKVLFATEDIYKDGEVVYRKGDAISAPLVDNSVLKDKTIDYIKTTEAKDTIATRIPLGHYKLVEVEAPLGFKKDLTENPVVLDPAHQTVKIVKAEPIEVENERQILTINANKVLLERKFPEGQTPEHLVFALYTREEVLGKPKDTLMDVANANADGLVEFKDVPAGKFYIKELSTVNGYILNDDEYDIKTGYVKDLDEDITTSKETEIENKPSEYTATVVKVDTVTGEGLAGVKFRLWKITSDGERELVRRENEDVWITDKDGKIKAEGLDEGNYEWEEIEVKPGYIEENKKVQIAVNEDSNLEVTIGNTPTEMSFVKIDAETGAKVIGAKLALRFEDGTPVYLKENNYVEHDTVKQTRLAEWETTEEPFIVRGLEVGKTYTLTETYAPDGYATADTVTFTVDNIKGIHVESVHNKYTDVRIIKRDWSSGEHVEDATLEIREVLPDGSYGDVVVDRVTGKPVRWMTGKGIEDGFVVRGLRVGVEHVILEPGVPEGYLPPAEVHRFIVNDTKEVQSTTFLNEPIPLIGTKAAFFDGTKENLPEDNLEVTDVVHLERLVKGLTYQINGKLVDANNPEKVLAEGTTTFEATETIQDVEVKFVLNAAELEGTTVVAFEELYRIGRKFEDGPIAEHKVPEDKDQSIYIPKIRTTAVDKIDGAHDALATNPVTIVDTISYSNLEPGTQHRAVGTLMNKVTGKPLLVNGEGVTSETVFTVSETGSGTVDVIFTIDASALANTSIVVFEKMYNGVEPNSKLIAEHEDIEDKEQSVHIPKIGTTAKDSDGTKEVAPADKTVTVIDAVKYENLIPGGKYTMKGVLMDKGTGKPLIVDGKEVVSEKEFTPEKKDGTVEMEFVFSPKGLDGKDLVVFEVLFNSNGKPVGKHEKIEDEGQTVHVPSLGTEADYFGADIEDKAQRMTITDVAGYTNLIVGKEYTMNGVLMDKETGKPLLVDGKEVRNSIKFIPKETSGFVKVQFKVPVSAVAGKTLVVFEDLVRDGKLVVTHYNIEDEDQTVEMPKIGTKADLVGAERHDTNRIISITDVVEYKNLKVGKEYTVHGTLMDKNTGEPLLVSGTEVKSQETFIPEKPNGTIEVVFMLPMDAVAGKTLVVFEDMRQDGKLVAIHHDIEDKGQTVEIPEIKTEANFDDNLKISNPKDKVKVIDKVMYRNLVVGKQYTMKGVLMDKDTEQALVVDGLEVTSELTFVAESVDGYVELEFELPGKALQGKTLVAFETLEKEDKVIAVHHDIEDEKQTVDVYKPSMGTTANVNGVDKDTDATEDVTITDRVEYKNLVPGKTYIVRGILMDKVSNQPVYAGGATVESYTEFKATQSNGYVDLDFNLDASELGDCELVVFERLYEVGYDGGKREEKFVISHEDINDEAQTVRLHEVPEEEEPHEEEEIEDAKVVVPEPKPKKKTPVGDESGAAKKSLIPIILVVIALLGAGGYFFYTKKRKNFRKQ